MLQFIIIVSSRILLKMFSLVVSLCLWLQLTHLSSCTENGTVIHFSVPERLRLCLACSGSAGPNVVWTLQDRRVLVTRQGGHETSGDPRRYLLRPDGGLCVLRLEEEDAGRYRCNQQLVAEVQVLTGHEFVVWTGRTLLLPCSGSSRPRQRWVRQREGGPREFLLTNFKNGTVKVAAAGAAAGRLSLRDSELQISDVQPEDGGEYLCNSVPQASVAVVTERLDPTSVQTVSSSMSPTSPETKTPDVETKRKEKKRVQNALLLVTISGFGLMIFLLVAVCVSLVGLKCRRRMRTKSRHEAAGRRDDTELQPWTLSGQQTEYEDIGGPALREETIHYASLGRPSWRERPGRASPDQSQNQNQNQNQDQHRVIYSSVITRPAARGRSAPPAAFI